MKRLATALVLIPIFVYLMLWAPAWLFLAAVELVAIFCFHEYTNVVARHGIAPPGPLGYAAGVVLVLAPGRVEALLVVIALLALALGLRASPLNKALPYAAALLLGVLYVFGALRCGAALRAFSPFWVLFAVSLNWVGDAAAFYAGRALGRHKLAPRVSPAKSWEGAIASVAATLIYAALYFPKLLPHVPLAGALGIAAVGNIAGQIGDLCESALKRGAGVKDSGSILPGHGGWLDRVDSSLFALPVIYFLVSTLLFR